MSIRTKISLLLAFLLTAAISNTYFIFTVDQESEEKLSWVNHTNTVILESERLLSQLLNAETGQRGYLLTTNPAYLEPYHRALIEIMNGHKRLTQLTSDNPVQQEQLLVIRQEIDAKLDELKATIELVNNGQRAQALELVEMNLGKQHMDNIRAELSQFISHERMLLEQRKGEFNQYRAKVGTLIYVEFVIFIGLAVFTLFFIRNNLFSPLAMLLNSAEKMKRGEQIQYSDLLPKNEINELLSTFVDLSHKISLREQALEHKAHHDALTGLKNRFILENELEMALLNIGQNKVAVLFIDVNKLKRLNDQHGHRFGDELLCETARRLQASVRESDNVYRIGGDEFIVLLNHIRERQDIDIVLSNITRSMRKSANIQGNIIPISLSIGVAIAPDDALSPEALIARADEAMYAAKKSDAEDHQYYGSGA
ncbi:diguanylate cyclase [Marinobacter hydrocarbonoclasticus]|nr:diguanylate cyclase [Marinobacter nauticus]